MPLGTSKTFDRAEGIKDIFRRACCACQLIMTSLTKQFKAPPIISIAELGKSAITDVNSTSGDIHQCKIPLLTAHSSHKWKSWGRRASGRATAGSIRAVPRVAAQTTPGQTVSWSIPITSYTCTFQIASLNEKFVIELPSIIVLLYLKQIKI